MPSVMSHPLKMMSLAMHVKRNRRAIAPESMSGESHRMATLGDRLREAREAKGMGQRSLARTSGVSQGHISHAESGKRIELGPTVLSALADALGVSVDWLLTGEGPRERRPDQTVEAVPRYAALREVLEAHPGRWSVAAVTVAEQRALKADVDPGTAWWEEQLDRLDNAIRLAELPMNAIAPKIPQRERPSAAAQRPGALGRPPKATSRGE